MILCNSTFGQKANDQDLNIQAIELHQEAKDLLAKDAPSSFDRITALGKFQKSQKLFSSIDKVDAAVQQENNTLIQELIDYFSSYTNSDSLLNTTLFYPDSVFQRNVRFQTNLKKQIKAYLDLRYQSVRRDFSKVEGLQYRSLTSNNGVVFNLDFEQYWPLEAIAMDRVFNQRLRSVRSFSSDAKANSLLIQYQNDFKELIAANKQDSIGLAFEYMQKQKKNLDAKIEMDQKEFDLTKKVGLGIIGLLLLLWYFTKRKGSQLLKNMNQTLLEEKKRSDDLLLNILPKQVVRELKNQGSAKANRHENVSVLFSDFKSFSTIAEQLAPEELVSELDFCFKGFDRIIDKYRLQKIKTIGDAYMCVGGIYTKGDQHISRMIKAALEIQLFLNGVQEERKKQGKHYFEARIGIHMGPIVAGVVGTKKFAYDIWGNTVNVAQQMEKHGEAGRVNISGETYERVKDEFECTQRGSVIAKNQKSFDMYFVNASYTKK